MNEVVTRAALWPTATATAQDGKDSRRATTPNKGGPNSHPGTTLLDAALIEAHALDGVKRWPTALARDANGPQRGVNAQGGEGLAQAVRSGRWPTPAASNFNDGEDPRKWRARQEALRAKGNNGNGAGVPLSIAAQEASYADERLADDSIRPGDFDASGRLTPAAQRRLGLPAEEASETTGQLSPAWVELLMGYPIGWTDPARVELCGDHQGWPAPQGAPQFDYEPSRLAGPDDAENRRARITALGNAVVRQCVTVAGARLLAIGAELEALERAAS